MTSPDTTPVSPEPAADDVEGLIERLNAIAAMTSQERGHDMVDDALLEAASALTAQAQEIERQERAHGETLDQRDVAEEALSQAYYLIVGRAADWSSAFGHAEALSDIDDAQSALRQEIDRLKGALVRADRLITALSPKAGGR